MVVAVIDTGITSHPDLNVNILAGYDFISDAATARDGNGRDGDPADEGDWHSDSGCAVSIPTDMAPIWPTPRSMPRSFRSVYWAAAAVRCRTSPMPSYRRPTSGGSCLPANANPAEVINMPLGGGTCSATMQTAINSAVSRGTTVVAAGDSSTNVSGALPANCANVIAVAATTSAGAKVSYSNFGAGIDICGAGSAILSTRNSGTTTPGTANYAWYNGTPMAAPHVARVVALVQSAATRPLTLRRSA
ncbi:extracellular protease [Xanthomonas fragariae]|nr:extracellular protease [Xanthomonas fragariae]